MPLDIITANEKAQLAFGAKLANACDDKGCVIFLQGDLGAGKTTTVRGFLSALGYQGKVKSPTYTLVESYELKNHTVLHVDLYRIQHPKEIEGLGLFDVGDYLTEKIIYLIEWPEKAAAELPVSDITCNITAFESKKGRACQIMAHTVHGEKIVEAMINA